MSAAAGDLLRWGAVACAGAALFEAGRWLWDRRQRRLAAARALGALEARRPWAQDLSEGAQAVLLRAVPPVLQARLRAWLAVQGAEPGLAAPLLLRSALVAVLVPAAAAAAGLGPFSLGTALLAALPWLRLRDRAERRRGDLRRALPEALDLLGAAVQAGLGLDPALQRVAQSLPPGPLRDELGRCLDELRLGRPRREAFAGLEARSGVNELGAVLRAILRSDQRGVPLAPVLKAQAAQLRRLRSLRVQKRAAEAPVKMLLPLIGFILPVVFLVVFGPIFLKLADLGF